MSTRSVRRAEERKRNKDARKAQLNPTAANAVPVPEPLSMLTNFPALSPELPTIDIQHQQGYFDRTMADLAGIAKAAAGGEQMSEERTPDACMRSSSISNPLTGATKPVLPATISLSAPSSRRGGPKTPEGKAVSSLNAVKTALTGRTVLLPTDDADAYRHHVAQYFKEWKPGSAREEALVQSLADTDWRIDRLPGLEYALFALGYLRFAELFPGEAIAVQKLLIEGHTLVTFEKQFRNLQIQEGRLHRQRERDQAELRQLKKERNDQERIDLECAAKLYLKAKQDRKPFTPADHGFEFSTVEINQFLEGVRAKQIYDRDLRAAQSSRQGKDQRAAHAA